MGRRRVTLGSRSRSVFLTHLCTRLTAIIGFVQEAIDKAVLIFIARPYARASYHAKGKQICDSLRRNDELRTAILCGWMSADELVNTSAVHLSVYRFG
jgi:hypothetical protein